ncbi:hypothetical protein [Pandoraea oxalativorans]|uniref:hypothetical protein n=1 Tax=Pandoraea oxalativorans TaxID=573737 RepID=UPI000A8C23B8|nr:hypothetical protein [Pandoraea oxalativorans]
MRTTWLTANAAAVLGLMGSPAQATEDLFIDDARGNRVLVGRLFSAQDRAYAYADDNTTPEFSTGPLSPAQKAQTAGALKHWADLLQVTPGRTPAILNIGTSATEDDVHAYSPHVFLETAPLGAGSENPTLVQAALQNHPAAAARYQQAHGEITVGKMAFSPSPFLPSQVPTDAQAHLHTLLVHEVAHALGIGSDLVRGTSPGGRRAPPSAACSTLGRRICTMTTATPRGPGRPFSRRLTPGPSIPRPLISAPSAAISRGRMSRTS